MATEARRDNNGYDWDHKLLSIDWATQDWRTILVPLVADNLPWEELQLSTIEYLLTQQDDYDIAHPRPEGEEEVVNPLVTELFRREDLAEQRPSARTDRQDVRDWVQDRRWTEPGRERQFVAPPEEDWSRDREEEGLPLGTIGLEFELPIAVYRRGDHDPHPNETRWLADIDESNGPADPAHVRQVLVHEVLERLNRDPYLAVIPRDPDEPPAGSDEYGSTQIRRPVDVGMQYDPTEALAVAARGRALSGYFNPNSGGKRLRYATEQDIQAALATTWLGDIPERVDVEVVRARFEQLLRAFALNAKRTIQATFKFVDDIKPRYRAFSVYTMPGAHFAGVTGANYADAPSGSYDPYHWEVIKIATPVMSIDPAGEVGEAIWRICHGMRENFRIHKDMPSIPVTTQVSISHNLGLDLIDIKRFVSLMVLLRGKGFHRLNRQHRSSGQYNNVCGPIKKVSRLGALCSREYQDIEESDDTILPQPREDERAERLGEMERNLPVDLIPALQGKGELSDRIFFASLWSYSNISQLAAALGPLMISRKMDVMIKVTGDGERSNHINPSRTGANEDSEMYFDVVDTLRGVIEFRHCGGSLTPGHIMSWATVCFCLVNSCKFSDERTFKDLLTRVLDSEDTIWEIFEINDTIRDFFMNNINERTGFFEPPDSDVRWEDPFYPPLPDLVRQKV